MSKQVTKTTTQQQQNQQYQGTASQSGANTNTYGFMSAPINAQTQGVIDAANTPAGSDPGLHARYAQAEEDVRRQYQDPMGAYTTPFVRQRAQLEQMQKIRASEDQAKREDYYNQQQQQFGRKLAAAQLTNPTLVNTGGTQTGTSSTSGSSSGMQTGTGTGSTGQNAFGQILDLGLGAAA